MPEELKILFSILFCVFIVYMVNQSEKRQEEERREQIMRQMSEHQNNFEHDIWEEQRRWETGKFKNLKDKKLEKKLREEFEERSSKWPK